MIYLDYHATTPCDPQVVEAMLPYFTEEYANPSSSTHKAGQKVANAVENAREIVAELIGAQPSEILFTAGATESNNLSILGLANGIQNSRRRIITTLIEHKAILEPYRQLGKIGYEVVTLPISKDGLVNLEIAHELINEKTLLVSIQTANNEIGTIQSISKLCKIAHDCGAFFHTDASQAVGKIPINVQELDVDFLSISAHKLYGPKGVGALYLKGGPLSTPIKPLFYGGGQEHSLRPGTYNVPAIVGFGEACKLCTKLMEKETIRITALRNELENSLISTFSDISINGYVQHRLPGNSNLTFSGIDSEALIANVPELALSAGSACNSGALEPSYVLQAIGLSREKAYQTLRIGIGRFTTESDIEVASKLIIAAVVRLKSLL